MFKLYLLKRGTLGRELLGTHRNLEAAMVATGAIGLQFDQLSLTQWLGEAGQLCWLIVKEQS